MTSAKPTPPSISATSSSNTTPAWTPPPTPNTRPQPTTKFSGPRLNALSRAFRDNDAHQQSLVTSIAKARRDKQQALNRLRALLKPIPCAISKDSYSTCVCQLQQARIKRAWEEVDRLEGWARSFWLQAIDAEVERERLENAMQAEMRKAWEEVGWDGDKKTWKQRACDVYKGGDLWARMEEIEWNEDKGTWKQRASDVYKES